ncbi:acetoacetate decarboxylase family protein [Saccharothrix sp. Mg75]|uniref:acetoacetate decarboxylase family protein n=1 Tax=Saccharothrix sp. Mg75 TaxID=3445357 RepID=UPI003EF04C6A
MVDYPPEPWLLHGRACVTTWLVPAPALPDLPVPPLVVGGRAVVGTAFVEYTPPGMAYRELLAAVVVRRPGVSITHIWVDSEASRAGGRELWGIPKEMAEFPARSRARTADGPIASVTCSPAGVGLRLPAAATAWQFLDGAVARTPLRAAARVTPARAAWDIAPDGPLGWLAPHRAVASVVVSGLRLRFGPRRR